jgi:hypothetical protein
VCGPTLVVGDQHGLPDSRRVGVDQIAQTEARRVEIRRRRQVTKPKLTDFGNVAGFGSIEDAEHPFSGLEERYGILDVQQLYLLHVRIEDQVSDKHPVRGDVFVCRPHALQRSRNLLDALRAAGREHHELQDDEYASRRNDEGISKSM